jgi:hypothetical protein
MSSAQKKALSFIYFGAVFVFGYFAHRQGIGFGQPLAFFALLFAAIEWINLPPFSWVRSNLAFGRSSLYLILAVGVVIVGLIWILAQGASHV